MAMFDCSNLEMIYRVARLVEMSSDRMVFVDAFALNVRSMASHTILKFLASFANVLNTAKGTLNKVNNIGGGTSDVLANDKRLFSDVAAESLSGYHVAAVFASGGITWV